jgi:hypothetical protein
MSYSIDFLLSVEDEAASDDEVQAILASLAVELDGLAADVSAVAVAAATGMIAKGEEKGNLLDVKINLDTLKSFGKWVYDRVVGTTTKVEFHYGGESFKFDGRKPEELTAAMEGFGKFVATIEAAKKAKNG